MRYQVPGACDCLGNRRDSRSVTGDREPGVRRNTQDATGTYRPAIAHRLARDRRARPRTRRVAPGRGAARVRQAKLNVRWSPGADRRAAACRVPRRACAAPGGGEHLRGRAAPGTVCWPARCAPGGTSADRHRRGDARRAGGLSAPMLMISDRPAHVADRLEPGYWEGDLIMGRGNRSAIGTLVERTSRSTILVHLGTNNTGPVLCAALTALYRAMPPDLARSLNWDQGKEMTCHLGPVSLIRPHCDGLIRLHLRHAGAVLGRSDLAPPRTLAVLTAAIGRSRKWRGRGWSCSRRSAVTTGWRTCRSGRWPTGMACTAGRCGRRWSRGPAGAEAAGAVGAEADGEGADRREADRDLSAPRKSGTPPAESWPGWPRNTRSAT